MKRLVPLALLVMLVPLVASRQEANKWEKGGDSVS
jgi:hypothetical protein